MANKYLPPTSDLPMFTMLADTYVKENTSSNHTTSILTLSPEAQYHLKEKVLFLVEVSGINHLITIDTIRR